MSDARTAVETRLRGAVSPVVAALDALGLNPDLLTALGLLLNLGAAVVVAGGRLGLGAASFLVASLFDMLDGSLARRQGRGSARGAFLDSTFDRISETALFVAILHDRLQHPYGPSWMPAVILLALAGALSTSYARARAEGLGQSCRVGWIERPERVLLLVVGLAAGREALGFVLFALAVLTWVTAVQRIVHVARELGREKE
jgi:CDP-diacylglycerol--glycerol-3-phosphate 3-phosphatidyltransferase